MWFNRSTPHPYHPNLSSPDMNGCRIRRSKEHRLALAVALADGEEASWVWGLTRFGSDPSSSLLAPLAVSAATAAAAAPPVAVAARTLFRPLARRRVLRALDQL